MAPLAIINTNVQTLQYPNGQFHYCFKDHQVSVKGFDGIAYPIEKDSKKAYTSTREQDSCFYLHKYFNGTATHQCSISKVQTKYYALLFKKGGCSVGVHFYNNTYSMSKMKTLSTEITNTLETNNLQTYKHQYVFDDKIIYDSPLGTSHFCFDNNHISLTGYDNIVYGGNIGSKSAYGFSDTDDSCFHSHTYFRQLSSQKCLANGLTLHPLRTYGHCFISMKTVNISLVEKYREYLIKQNCHGCNKGSYFNILDESHAISVNNSIIFVYYFIIFLLGYILFI